MCGSVVNKDTGRFISNIARGFSESLKREDREKPQ